MDKHEWLQIGFDRGIIDCKNSIISEKENMIIENKERTVTLRKDGRYMCYAYLASGRKAVYGKTEEKAIENAVKRENQERFELERQKYLFEFCYKKWFMAKLESKIRPQTTDRIESTYNKYFTNDIKELDIRTLDSNMAIDFLVKCVDGSPKGRLTRKEFSKIMQVIRGTYQLYCDNYVLENNKQVKDVIAWDTVKRKVEEKCLLYTPRKKEIAVSGTEQNAIREVVLKDEKFIDRRILGLCWLLEESTGLRIGELASLTWKDIDFENEVIYISKTVCKYYQRDSDGNRIKQIYDIGKPKTAHGVREIPLTDKALKVLNQLLKLQKECGWYNKDELLCYSGRRIKDVTNALYKNLRRISKVAGIEQDKHIYPHLLRKTVATNLHDAGMSTRDIADLLGHSEIGVTEQCYIISTELEKKRKKMAAVL